MSDRDDISTPIGQIFAVGLSSIIQIDPSPGQNSIVIKGVTFSSLEIGGATLSWGIGYPFSIGEALSFNGMGAFYLAASGQTALVAIFRGRSTGYEET